jgi:hypothetical protein
MLSRPGVEPGLGPDANHDQYEPKEPNNTESFSKRSLLGVRRDCPDDY